MSPERSYILIRLAIIVALVISLYAQDPPNRLHIFLSENDLLKYGDTAYVRVYQTVFSSTEGASQTIFPDNIKYKDIWQDVDSRIIIVPGKSPDDYTWLGIGDPRNQLKFVVNYQTQVNPAENPLVRSFLVDYETVQKILTPRRIVTEDPKYTPLGLSMNVDKFTANQFGINHPDADELRKNALPGSLVTYTSKAVDKTGHEHWGTIRPLKDLYDKLGLPGKDIPGAYSDTVAKERTKGTTIQIDNYLEEIEKLYLAGNSETDIHRKIEEFNSKYVSEKITVNDLPIEGIDLKLEKQKLTKKIKKQVANFERDLRNMYANSDTPEVEIENKINEYNEKFGTSVEEKLSASKRNLPNLDKDTKSVIKQLVKEIGQLNKLHTRSRVGENVDAEIKSRINKYNKFLVSEVNIRELRTSDLPNIHAFVEEARTRRKIRDRFYNDHLDPQLKSMDKLQWEIIPNVKTDHMFIDGKDVTMNELREKGLEYRKDFQRGKKFLATVEAYSNELNDVITKDSKFKRLKGLMTPHQLLTETFPDDPVFLKKIKNGFFYGNDGFRSDRVTSILNRISEKVADKIPNGDIKLPLVEKLKQITISVTEEKHRTAYSSEIILQLERSKEVNKASDYLYKRYQDEGKNVMHITYGEDGLFHTENGKRITMDFDENTRISVIGHGRESNSHLTIAGKDSDTLAKDLSRVLLPKNKGETLTIGKISLIACNVEANQGIEIGSRFGQNLVEALSDDHIQTAVTVRVGQLQVTEDGYKLYGKVSENHFRDKPPLLVKTSINAGKQVTEYGFIDSIAKRVKWNTELPEYVFNTKLLILSEGYGSFDIADIVEKTHLKSMKIVGENIETSGILNVQEQDILLNTDRESQPKRLGTYLVQEADKNAILSLVDESGIQSVLTEIDAADWVKRLSVATSESLQSLPNTGDWIPIIDTAEINSAGNTKVTVVNLDTSETRSIEMKSDAFVQFKKRSNIRAMSVRYLPKFTKSTIGMTGTGGLLGFGGFIMSAIQLSKAKKCKENVTCPATEAGRKLAKSLEINAYIGFVMSTYGVVSDSVQIAELAVSFKLSKNAVNGIATMTKTTSKFLQFSKVFGAIGMGVGAVGSVVSLGFSAYNLAHAQNKAQKIEFGIQVGIDSVSVIASGVAIGATIAAATTSSAAASSVAAAAGPIGIAVAVVGILASVITSLTFEFINTRNNARLVGEYFYSLDQVYQKSGFNFNYSSKTFKILENAVVKGIDFEEGIIELDSQFIYRTRHGSTGSGKINYFFWFKDFPEMIHDKNQAINIRSGIGYRKNHKFYNGRDAETLILPAIPKSYISYGYSRLPFCTAMHDKGFDIIRRLERDYRFDYDFYIFPGEQIVSSITHEYVNTDVTVKLTNNVKTIAVPDISDSKYNYLHNKYTFILTTKGHTHTILLQDFYAFVLQSESSTTCIWYLSYANIDFDDIKFLESIIVGKSNIRVSNVADKIFIFDDDGGMLLVDPNTKTKTLISVVQNSETPSWKLRQYLKSMDMKWLKSQKYVIIAEFKDSGTYIGRAFYDVLSDTFLFTNLDGVHVSKEFKDNVQLLGVFQDDAYFMSNESSTTVIWRTNIRSKQVIGSYMLYCGNEAFHTSKLSTVGNYPVLIQKVKDVSLIYMIMANEIKLIFIDGTKENIFKLADYCFPTLNEFLPRSSMQIARLPFPGTCLYATTVPILPIKQTLSNGMSRHFWVYINESSTQESTKTDIFCTQNKPPIATGLITPNIENECENLTLRDIQHLHTGDSVYFFYCEGDKEKFYYQVGDNESVPVFVPGGIDRIEDFGVIKLIKSQNGGLYKFTPTTNFTLAALSFDSIALSKNWKEAFNNITEQGLTESFIPIMNMKNSKGKVITAWFDSINDRLIIVSPSLDAQNITYLGPSPSSTLVWLYNPNERQVILQKIMDDEEISNMITRLNNDAFWKDDVSPIGKEVIGNVNSVEYRQGEVFVVTEDGVMLYIDYLQAFSLQGVNTTWIKTNHGTVRDGLEKLCNQYKSQSLITMGQQSTTSTYRWYHCAMKGEVVLSTRSDVQPIYLGITKTKKLIFFLVGNDVIQMEETENKGMFTERVKIAKVENAMIRGKTLLFQSKDYSDLKTFPKLDNISSLVIVTAYDSEVIIESQIWLHYDNIFITSVGTSGPQLTHVKINPPYHCLYQFEEFENDTVIKDPISDRVIVLEDFNLHYDKYDENYVGNEAVLKVEMCNKTTTLVTNRERFDPVMSHVIDDPTTDIFTIGKLILIMIIIIVPVVLISMCILKKRGNRGKDIKANKYKRKRDKQQSNMNGGNDEAML